MGVEDNEDDPIKDNTEGFSDEIIAPDLSHLHSMDDTRRSKSLTLAGMIVTEALQVLVDTGSSHDFLHPRVAEKLQHPLTAVKPFRVYVGNGESLLCSHISKATELIMQGTSFLIDLHIFPMHGPEVVLGMEWLELLGRVTTDFVKKSMEFTRGDEVVILTSAPQGPR